MTDYDAKLREAFTECNKIDDHIAQSKQTMTRLQLDIATMQTKRDALWQGMADLMREHGVTEEILETSFCKMKLYFSEPKGSVNVPDVDALPYKFKRVRTVVEPDKKEIGEHLKSGAKVNWASMEYGEPRLVCKAMNK